MAKDPLPVLVLLNNLSEAGYLTGSLSNVQGGRWRQSLVTALGDVLQSAIASPREEVDNRRVLGHVLHLLPSISTEGPRFSAQICDLIKVLASTTRSEAALKQQFQEEGPWNSSHLFAQSLQCVENFYFNGEIQDQLKSTIVNAEFLASIAGSWSWNREIMERVAFLAELDPASARSSAWPTDELHPHLISSDSSLRLSILRILALLEEPASDTTSDPLWQACLRIERCEMSLKNVRERTSQIARVARLLKALPSDHPSETLSQVFNYLLSQLKVNFRPLYAETTSALGELGQRYGETIWTAIWSQVEKVATSTKVTASDLDAEAPNWAALRAPHASHGTARDEEEPEYRCHNAEKALVAFTESWSMSTDTDVLDAAEVPAQVSSDRLDVLNYEAQLLAALAAISSTTEKHTRVVAPAFFAVAEQLEDGEETLFSTHLSTRQRQQRTANWMELLATFVNPKAAFRSEELHALYLRILAKGDVKLQGLAISCLLTYKSSKLVPYEDNLRHLLDDSKYRDELARFTLGTDSETINPADRDEIIPVAIRVLYGILTSRRGRSSSQTIIARKRAALTALSGCTPEELATLVDLMLEPFSGVDLGVGAAGRQQIGFLSLLSDVLRYLAPQTLIHWSRLIDTTVRLIGSAQAQIDKERDSIEEVEQEEEEDAEPAQGSVPVRQIRSTGIKRIVQFLRCRVDFDYLPFLANIYRVVISPRLNKLEVENTQAPSGILDLIAAIAALPETASALVEHDKRTLPKVFACLTAVKVKTPVIAKVFDIMESLLDRDSHDILLENIRPLLDNIIGFVEARGNSSNDDLTKRLLAILARVSAIVTDGVQAQQLANLLLPMLQQTGKQQPEKTKIHVLETLKRLLLISPDFSDPSSDFSKRIYNRLSLLLQNVFFPATRRTVVEVLQVFGPADPSLQSVLKLVADLNAYSPRRLDEPDFDRRLTAFATINDAALEDLPETVREWMPLLRSALFFIKDPEELSIRTNASALLKRFIDKIGTASEGPYVDALNQVVLPGLRHALRSKLELVRNEVLVVIAYGVQVCEGVPMLAELKPLLGEDDDTSFFVNFSHIQVHRRARALRRLRDTVADHEIRESTIANFFMPALEHVIAGSTEVTDHHLVNEAILTVGALSAKLGWSKYNVALGRYLRLGSTKTPQQKLYIRAVSAIIDHFHFNLSVEDVPMAAPGNDEEVPEDEDEEAEAQDAAEAASKRIADVVLHRLLPALSKFVSQKDENEDSVRIPLALPTVKLANALPAEAADTEIIKVVTIVSQILRSKDQDTRDIARDTIGKIAVFLGPEWLGRVLAELQTALQRGPQKHVAAVTTHSILVQATGEKAEEFSDLDIAVNDAMRISADVIWGESGKDAANEVYKTKMREVRSATTRGLDTVQLLARLVSPSKIAVLLEPVREVMHASQAIKTMAQVDETLRRIALGLNANTRVRPEDVLNLCYSLISGNSAYIKPKRKAAPTSQAADSYRVQMKRDNKEEDDFYHLNAHKFVSFGLDLFVTAFRRGRFDFDDVDTLSRLGPLVSAIGNTLYSPTASVLLLGFKATAAICRCPIPQVETALPAFISNTFKVIKQHGGSAESEVAQTALKTLAVIIRDCKASKLSDSQLRYLFEIISPDLEETDRQAAIFAVLRAVVSRRMVVPEIYDLMGSVSSIMVTSQSTHVQELCRGVLMAFLLDYPQGKSRLKSQMTFLAQNLNYVFESGRVSVMELLNAVFTKFNEDLLAEYADLFFVALVAVIANDEVEKCRTMAGALLQTLVGKLDASRVEKLVGVLKSWVEGREAQPALAGASLAVFGLLSEVPDIEQDVLADMISSAAPVIEDSASALAEAEASESAFATSELDYNLPHHALVSAGKALKAMPSSSNLLPWDGIIAHLLFPHDWVRLAAARALAVPVTSGGDVLNDDQCLDIARKSCLLLQGSKNADGEKVVVDGKLCDQLVKLLWNIAKRWAVSAHLLEIQNNTDLQDRGSEVTIAESEDEESEDEADEGIEQRASKSGPLAWLMSRMSFVARHILVHRPSPNAFPVSNTHWTAPLLSVLRFFAGVMEHLDVAQARRFLVHVLSPIYRVLDDSGDLTSETGTQIGKPRSGGTKSHS